MASCLQTVLLPQASLWSIYSQTISIQRTERSNLPIARLLSVSAGSEHIRCSQAFLPSSTSVLPRSHEHLSQFTSCASSPFSGASSTTYQVDVTGGHAVWRRKEDGTRPFGATLCDGPGAHLPRSLCNGRRAIYTANQAAVCRRDRGEDTRRVS